METFPLGQGALYLELSLPLLTSPSLARYWSDSLVVDSIQKDVIRTYPDLHFFLEKEGQCQTCLQNILFLYAKLNPGIKYVQVGLLTVCASFHLSALSAFVRE
jgi:hypothetical protein